MTLTPQVLPTPQKVLFVHYGDDWIRGSERCLIDLITHLDKTLFEPVLWCNSERLANEVRPLDIPVYVSNFTLLLGERAPKWDVIGFSRLVSLGLRIVDEHQISLIHSNSGAPSQWLNLVSRARKLPLVLHLHSRYPLRDRITLGLHHASMAVGVSQPVVDQLLTDGAVPDRCQVIPNGIDTEALLKQPVEDIRRSLGLPSDAFVAVSICSLIHRKGVDLLIEACKQLRELRLPVHLVVIGEGSERKALEAQIAEAHLTNYVHLVGEKHNVVGLMRGGADLCISGAREEVFGLTLAEAGLASLPVIAPRVGGIPSVISHQKTGLLVPTEDAHALAQAIYHLFVNQNQRLQLGVQGHQHVLANFTIKTHTSAFEALYNGLLNNPAMTTKWMSHWQFVPPVKASFAFVKNYRKPHPVEVAV
ncbi:glycosyltransferase [Enterovibrio norvegicus FF-454]|uniref:Glycosyltransferase n=1 Tax=Enterovibrio norvegicus FF-454 TaxID=1185651 RepID=A0A1E5C5Y2_9GAMM|nr:glycosyltransferase [Enterovibrio norvegicus]OEE60857.1 glycosyltransferase [Enterovibrio norvegicus FF-454]